MKKIGQSAPRVIPEGGETMLAPETVAAMLKLRELGWGIKRIAREIGCAKATVRRWVNAGGFAPYRRPRGAQCLDAVRTWLTERFFVHGGNADVLRQELAAEHAIVVSLRTVQRAVKPLRRELAAAARATLRFETAPGRQLQIDFGERRVSIADESVRVYLFVATLGYSRRVFVRAFASERQADWIGGIEAAFAHFGGVPTELLVDNARALVDRHDVERRVVEFNAKFAAFARHWGVQLRACAPYRARTKGKDERGVGYVKKNAIAGRRFASWSQLDVHLERWMREIADQRVHGTTGERPIDRFAAREAAALRPLAGRTPFLQVRELMRTVQADGCVEVDTNAYSVPWRLIGERMRVVIEDCDVCIFQGSCEIARHHRAAGRRERVIDRRHLIGVVGAHRAATPTRELLRPLDEYSLAVEGERP